MSKSLFKSRTAYKPFEYPWAFEAFKKSEQMHWLVREVPLNEDVKDWRTRLTTDEQQLATQIFRFFTQADCDVASAYVDAYLPRFKPVEVRMMLLSIAAREAVHIQAYSTLIDEIGMPETEYAAFTQYAAMTAKHDYMFDFQGGGDMLDLARNLAVFSAFGEGMQLFSSFVILLNFTRRGLMKGMGQVVAWSIRDETHHVDSMVKLWHELLAERPELRGEQLESLVLDAAQTMVKLEDRFVDLAYGEADVAGLTPDEVKLYIRHVADGRLRQLGYEPLFGVDKNPLPWVNKLVFGKEHANFFETRPTDYGKGNMKW